MSLHYPFPLIETLDDVLPHLDDGFRVVEKEGMTFINYIVPCASTFPPVVVAGRNRLEQRIMTRATVRRECRGIAFDSHTGKIISRPFHKFFNAGEREDIALDMIDMSRPHVILEKLDGSMIRPLPTAHGMRWGTKMGLTDVGMLAEAWVADKSNYLQLALDMHERGFTPIFEFCSRSCRIVLDYPEDRLSLLAIRATHSGTYLLHRNVVSVAKRYGVEVVHADLMGTIADMVGYVEHKREEDAGEGVVIAFEDGHRLKVKTDWYVRVHRAKELMRSERRLLELILAEEVDDLLPTLQPEDRDRVQDYVDGFWSAFTAVVIALDVAYENIREEFPAKRDFATGYAFKLYSPMWRAMIFAMWDGKAEDARAAVLRTMRANMTTGRRFEEMKDGLGLDTGWDSQEEEELAA